MNHIDLSLCIVTLEARDFLRDCLQSIGEATTHITYEIIVVDQNSQDGTPEMIKNDFPHVKLIESTENDGFVGGSNRAMRAGHGRYLALLNPDTIILPGALDLLCAFLDSHPDAGVVGPKVLNVDGSLQEPCRRGDPRPWAVISYFSGLAKRFPDKAFFNGYLLTHLDEDQTYPVDGVSGCCMLVRKEVVEKIGYLDENFFIYQEDADYCLRTRNAGWKVYYYPEAKITHYGGQGGSRVEPVRSIINWHKSYYLYYRKHFAKDYFFLFNWLYYIAMGTKFLLTLAKNALSKDAFGGSRKPG
jgi:GT2 family glycosyltransferase